MSSIDVYILTGYLGAGKTTTLNNLLRMEMFAEKEAALIINEFGGMNVDSALVEPGWYTKYEINRACPGFCFFIFVGRRLVGWLVNLAQLSADAGTCPVFVLFGA